MIKLGYEPDKTLPDGLKVFSREFCARLPEEHVKSAYVTGGSVDFIENNKDNPFILYINFLEPHMPYFGPRDDQYDISKIPLPENFYHEINE